MLHLEQVILRSGVHKTCSNIKQVSGGIDFFFSTRSQAATFVNFLSKRSPCRVERQHSWVTCWSSEGNTLMLSHPYSPAIRLRPQTPAYCKKFLCYA
ncbi:unnamed protein product, partial [Trichobilharzia regenti]